MWTLDIHTTESERVCVIYFFSRFIGIDEISCAHVSNNYRIPIGYYYYCCCKIRRKHYKAISCIHLKYLKINYRHNRIEFKLLLAHSSATVGWNDIFIRRPNSYSRMNRVHIMIKLKPFISSSILMTSAHIEIFIFVSFFIIFPIFP